MTRSFKILSALLSYPGSELVAATDEILAVLKAEKLLTARQIDQLAPLLDELKAGDIYDLQERYILLFDRTRSLSLHMFEHVHGENRDRGQAMVDLKALYEQGGMETVSGELPDYLPLFLEFLSTRPIGEALDLVGQPAHIFAALAEKLGRRKSSYAGVFHVLAKLAKADPKSLEVRQLLEVPDVDPDDLEALDAAWVDEEVRFGPSAEAQCGGDALIPKLRAGRRPAPGAEVAGQSRPRTLVTHSPSRVR
jgi:nitrate reductase delta subunit